MFKKLLLTSASLLAAQIANAQADTNSKTQSLNASELEVVVVTASKKAAAETVQEVPFAVTAFGSTQLEDKFVRSLESLSYDIPNVQFQQAGTTKGVANFSIRGLGINSSIASVEPTVGVFVDGVYQGLNQGIVFDNFDLEGIEVLRGPQGLLFGKNVTGGAVVLRTTRPSFDFKATGRYAVEIGSEGEGLNQIASGVMTGPIVQDVLAAKLAVYYNYDDGWFENGFNGKRFGRSKEILVRPGFSLQAGENFRADLRLEYGEIDGQGPAAQNYLFARPGTFTFYDSEEGFNENDWRAATLEMNLDVGENGLITNIAGYREFEQKALGDFDGRPTTVPRVFTGSSILEHEQFSDELRYAGTFGSIELTTGVYYLTQDLEVMEQRFGIAAPTSPSGGGVQDMNTKGVFASVDWGFTDTLTLNVGGRYTWEEKSAKVATLGPSAVNATGSNCNLATRQCTFNFSDSEEWSSFTPKVGLQWQPSDALQMYTFWTRGFRSGGYNMRSGNPNVAPGPFDQETQNSYELGLKYAMKRGFVNAAVFYNEIDDMQREVPTVALGTTAVDQTIRNTADTRIQGAEIEVQFAVLENLILSGNAGYVEGEYTSIKLNLAGSPAIDAVDYALEVPRLAPWTYGAGATFNQELGGLGKAAFRATFNHRDENFFPDNNSTTIPAVDMVDAAIGFTSASERFRLSVYGKNLLNESAPYINVPLGAAGNFAPLAKGRVYGTEFSVKFD